MSHNMSRNEMLEELLNSLLDETLSEADEARLAEMLATSSVARSRYRQWMELHASLHWDYAAAATQHSATPLAPDTDSLPRDIFDAGAGQTGRSGSPRSLLLGGSLAAAGLLALAISWFVVLQRPGDSAARGHSGPTLLATGEIVELVSQGGAASWSNGGVMVSDLAVGNRLSAGTVSLEGQSAFITLRFDDGTAVTLTGESMLEFDARWQKTLVLRHGTLSVDARPQPHGRPMLIRTPTAEVEVVGTIFSVSSDSQVTHVGVEEGSVRFLRLADRQSVEVREHNVATASLVTTEPLAAGLPASIPPTYREEFRSVSGTPVGLRAVPYIAGREDDGRPIVHFGITTRKDNFGFVTLHDDSVVSVRFRTATPETIRVMLSMRRPGGGFGGNFEIKFPSSDGDLVDRGEPDGTGWRWIHIPANMFASIIAEFPKLTPGHAVGMLLVATFSDAARLEVAEITVSRQAGATATP